MATSTTTVEFNEGRIVNADEIHPVLCLVYRTADGTWQPMTQPGGGGGGPSTTVNITDAGGTNIVGIKALNVQVVATDLGLITNTVIHGLTTGGGGGYVDVKVNPSGALTVENTPAGSAVLADGIANPTVAGYGAYLLGYNGVTWDRLRSTTANGLVVDVSRVQGTVAVTQSGAWAATISGTVAVSNFPAVQPINDNGGSITVDGTVAISGSVTVTGPLTDAQLRATPVPVSAASLPLPTGAATEATLGTRLAETTFTGRFPAGAALGDAEANPTVSRIGANLLLWNNGATQWERARASSVNSDGEPGHSQGALDVMCHSFMYNGTNWDRVRGTIVDGLLVNTGRSTTSTRTSVAGAAADTLLLAANANRRGFTVHNDSSAILYLALGTVAASTTNFTVKMVADAYYEVPFQYTGEVRGIWASATGSARISELT